MIATAIVATVRNVTRFANGRQMAAALGLTPRQNSSGGKERLLGSSKRGDAYLRMRLIHGARSMIGTAGSKTDRLSQWVMRIASNPAQECCRSGIGKQERLHRLGNDHERIRLLTQPRSSQTAGKEC